MTGAILVGSSASPGCREIIAPPELRCGFPRLAETVATSTLSCALTFSDWVSGTFWKSHCFTLVWVGTQPQWPAWFASRIRRHNHQAFKVCLGLYPWFCRALVGATLISRTALGTAHHQIRSWTGANLSHFTDRRLWNSTHGAARILQSRILNHLVGRVRGPYPEDHLNTRCVQGFHIGNVQRWFWVVSTLYSGA